MLENLLGNTFLVDISISRRAPTRSLFVQEYKELEFESKVAQYFSSCTLESQTGTQCSTNFDESDFRSYAIYRANLSFNIGSASVFSLESFFKLLECIPSPNSRNESKFWYSCMLSWKNPKSLLMNKQNKFVTIIKPNEETTFISPLARSSLKSDISMLIFS